MADDKVKNTEPKALTARERLVAKVNAKMERGEVLDNNDLLALQGKVWMFDPSVGAYHEIDVEDAEKFLETMQQVQEAVK